MSKQTQPKRVEYHVVPAIIRGDLTWSVHRGGKRIDIFPWKVQAVRRARNLAREEACASLRIHGRDGRIQEERSYPRRFDPRRTKG